MSDKEDDLREGNGDERDRTDDRSALWDRALGLLLGRDPMADPGATEADRPTWEEPVDERDRGERPPERQMTQERSEQSRRSRPAGSQHRQPSTRQQSAPRASEGDRVRPARQADASDERSDEHDDNDVPSEIDDIIVA
jgi:hypothetical protein